MTDEEMAEEYLQEKLEERKDKFVFELPEVYITDVKKAFLAGFKAGSPQWHTPDARLPEEEGDYLFCLRDGEETTIYDIVGVSIDGNGYVSLDSHIWSITDVIAWCELPEFEDK